MGMTSCTGSVCEGFGGIWKKVSELSFASEEDGWLSLARRRLVSGAHVLGGGRRADGKASIERLCISLPYVETFNSKVIKGFVPGLRSPYVFFVFRDSYVLCIYVMNIGYTFLIFIYGYVTLLIICLFLFKWFQILQSNINSFICT